MGMIVATEVPCVGCGYNLQMQPVGAVCTECGLPVQQSLDQTILRWWSRRLKRMAIALRWAATLTIIMPLLLVAGVVLDDIILSEWLGTHAYSQWVGAGTFGTMGLCGALYVVAVFVATDAPRGQGRGVSRWLCRLGALCIPLALAVPTLSIILQELLHPTDWRLLEYMRFIMPLFMLGWVVHVERAAALSGWVLQRGGMKSRAGLGVWSLRLLAVSLLGLTVTFLAEELLIWLFLDDMAAWSQWEPIGKIIRLSMGGTALLAAISLIFVPIGAFKLANRLSELSRLAEVAEAGSWTREAPAGAAATP